MCVNSITGWKIEAIDRATHARTARFSLGDALIRTPAFMPVGTNATVKAIELDTLSQMGIRLILSNAYHLYLRPGLDVIRAAGGLHRFMNWEHGILTDSGGFQVFSLAPLRKIEENGVSFRSHIDGSMHRLSPEDVVEIQASLGSDIMMPLDVCTPFGVDEAAAKEAVMLTYDWAFKSRKAWMARIDKEQAAGSAPARMEGRAPGRVPGHLFGIVQGNFFPHLRRQSAGQLVELDLPGYAIGGLSVGENPALFEDICGITADCLPKEKPRYVMGIGTPEYILAAVERGIDMFDCVFPTRIARNCMVFTADGTINLRNEKYKLDQTSLDPECKCPTCAGYSRSYLRHLYKTREILASMLATRHNLWFLEMFLENIRGSIVRGDFSAFKKAFLSRYLAGRQDK